MTRNILNTAKKRFIFDIETAPDPHKIAKLLDPFDPAAVRLGNLKDEDKIKEKLKVAEADHYHKASDKAALHAETLTVCAIGIRGEGVQNYDGVNDDIIDADRLGEKQAIILIWEIISDILTRQDDLCGYNCKNFDLPILIRRSFHLGVAVPACVHDIGKRRWHSRIVDLMEVYGSGEWGFRISLDRLSRSLDLGKKSKGEDECSGKHFHKFWRSPEDHVRQQAKEYLLNDLDMTEGLANRLLGILGSSATEDAFLDLEMSPA